MDPSAIWQVVDALPVGDLCDVRLDELRAVHEAKLPVAFVR